MPKAHAPGSGLAEPPEGYRRGVGIMLINRAGQVFVAKRLDTRGAWQMPQGGIDKGETPYQACLREMAEEIGTAKAEKLAESAAWHAYDLPVEIRHDLWGGRYKGQAQKWFLLRFTGADSDIDLNTHMPEFDEWKWIEAAELPRLAVDFKQPLYRALLDEFAPILKRPL
jgi:putative (di)nucleoside polyphosphate hydrolase